MNIFVLRFGLILFLLTQAKGQSNNLGLKKCCSWNQVFDTNYLLCVTKPSDVDADSVTLLPDKLIEKKSLSSYSSHNISNQDLDIALTKCRKMKVLQMGDHQVSISTNTF